MRFANSWSTNLGCELRTTSASASPAQVSAESCGHAAALSLRGALARAGAAEAAEWRVAFRLTRPELKAIKALGPGAPVLCQQGQPVARL